MSGRQPKRPQHNSAHTTTHETRGPTLLPWDVARVVSHPGTGHLQMCHNGSNETTSWALSLMSVFMIAPCGRGTSKVAARRSLGKPYQIDGLLLTKVVLRNPTSAT
ncbi:uncharacterized protein LOC107263015 isoform X2 [Cephus cinctus]|uniref:Uncharacterized protein LOC107263015 isoform X2 n=1 Tax=Cephus cinctus TaxID=211228 RepID=A0AAJ7R9B4_CEPCN|nr:uncharacterized protein LOC107263015 isoform X2 [Cephus cinctus]